MRSTCLFFLMLLFSSSAVTAQDLTLVWKLENEFNMPESATFDSSSQFIFVSNVNEYAKDGNGFISRVSIDGSSVDLRWLDDLDSPTVLAVFDGLLFFADFDSLVVADIATAQIRSRYVAPDALVGGPLNGIDIHSQGDLVVVPQVGGHLSLLR